MLTRNALPFPPDEYRTRLERVRGSMAAAGVEVMLTAVPENIVYLTGHHSLGYFTYQILILSLDQSPILLTRALNVEKARVDSCLDHIEGYGDTEDPDATTHRVLDQYGLLRKRIGNQDDAWFFSVARYKKLIHRLGVDDLADCSGLIERVRRVKSPAEIAYIREAGRYCAASLEAAIAAVRPGVLETEVSAAAHDALHKAGSEYLGHSPQFVAGPAAGLAFECAGRRPIRKDDVVYMEAGGTHNRYNCMLSRTVIVGHPDRKWIAMAEASRDALNAAKETIRAGVTSHEVDRAARDAMRRAGFAAYFVHRTGYAIGIGFPPDWGEGRILSINENDPTVLEAGMCFHLIPDLKVAMAGGVVFSESVAVTETGYDLLTPYSQDIFYR
ncbi:MAG TPA: Xaa-Pro peptidase family protein [Methylomirabilota bacterium]|jgi:Xaa-Pro dipeptidase|nr:Xaa-Pro peptidase family protein [Methylomirabilota bacterium]